MALIPKEKEKKLRQKGFPPLIGFGIPQRTPNYILGKPLNPP